MAATAATVTAAMTMAAEQRRRCQRRRRLRRERFRQLGRRSTVGWPDETPLGRSSAAPLDQRSRTARLPDSRHAAGEHGVLGDVPPGAVHWASRRALYDDLLLGAGPSDPLNLDTSRRNCATALARPSLGRAPAFKQLCALSPPFAMGGAKGDVSTHCMRPPHTHALVPPLRHSQPPFTSSCRPIPPCTTCVDCSRYQSFCFVFFFINGTLRGRFERESSNSIDHATPGVAPRKQHEFEGCPNASVPAEMGRTMSVASCM